MAGLVATMLSVAIAFWIYLDATGHGIGKDPAKNNFWELSAGGWATWGLCLWPLGLLIYLIRRKSLITRATAKPVRPENKTRSVIFLAVVSAAAIGFSLSSMADPQSGYSTSTNGEAQSGLSAQTAPQLPAMTDAEIRECEMRANIIVRTAAPFARIYGQDYAMQQAQKQIQAELSQACQVRLAREWTSQ